MAHIDCPEKNQPFSYKAKQLASDLCFGKTVKVVSEGKTDRYKRLIAEIYVGKECVNQKLVQKGMAWHYKHHSKSILYANLEKIARQKKVGLWSDPKPIPPWQWRKDKRKNHVKKEVLPQKYIHKTL